MQIAPKIVLLALVTVMIVEPPGWTVAKTTSKHGKSASPKIPFSNNLYTTLIRTKTCHDKLSEVVQPC